MRKETRKTKKKEEFFVLFFHPESLYVYTKSVIGLDCERERSHRDPHEQCKSILPREIPKIDSTYDVNK